MYVTPLVLTAMFMIKAQDPNKPVLRLFHPYEHRQLIRAVASRVVARFIADGTYMDILNSDDANEDGLSSLEQYVTEEWRVECRRRPLRGQYAVETVHLKYVSTWFDLEVLLTKY